MNKRLFVAIDLPESLKERLGLMCSGIPNAKWVTDEQMHLTLRFIGEVDGSLYHEIKEALFDIQFDLFDLVLEGVGHFPPRGQPTVLWVGIEKSEPLLRLRNKIEAALISLGLEPEPRKFSPHITLARLKDAPIQEVGQFLTGYSLFKTEPFDVAEFMLFSSTLTSKGSIYDIEEVYSLED